MIDTNENYISRDQHDELINSYKAKIAELESSFDARVERAVSEAMSKHKAELKTIDSRSADFHEKLDHVTGKSKAIAEIVAVANELKIAPSEISRVLSDVDDVMTIEKLQFHNSGGILPSDVSREPVGTSGNRKGVRLSSVKNIIKHLASVNVYKTTDQSNKTKFDHSNPNVERRIISGRGGKLTEKFTDHSSSNAMRKSLGL